MAHPDQSWLTMTTQLSLFDDLTIQPAPQRGKAASKRAPEALPPPRDDDAPRRQSAKGRTVRAAAQDTTRAVQLAEPPKTLGLEPKSTQVTPATGSNRAPANLAEAVAMLGEGVCSHKRRATYRSDMRMFAKAAGKPLDQISTDPLELRAIMARIMPATMGWSAGRWKAVRSGVVSGLRVLNDEPDADHEQEPIAAEWEALLTRVTDPWIKVGLSKLLRYLSRRGITPALLTAAAFDDFKAEQLARSLKDNPAGSIRVAAKNWNAAARNLPDWPQVRLEAVTDTRRFSVRVR